MYRIDKTMLFFNHGNLAILILSTKNFSAFKTSTNAISVNTFWVRANAQNVLHQPTRSLNLFLKLGTALFCRIFFHVFFSAAFNSETVIGFGRSFQKTLCITCQIRYLQGVQIWREWDVHCLFWISCRQFACRHLHAVCEQPCASHWICCCAWQ